MGHSRSINHEVGGISELDLEGAMRVLRSLEQRVRPPLSLVAVDPAPMQLASLAKNIRSARDMRRELLGPDIFGEPAWDILLSLYVASAEEYRMKVSAICNESGVPDTTALRWLDILSQRGLIEKIANPLDARSRYVSLTGEGRRKMEKLLAAIWKHFLPIH